VIFCIIPATAASTFREAFNKKLPFENLGGWLRMTFGTIFKIKNGVSSKKQTFLKLHLQKQSLTLHGAIKSNLI